MLPTKKEIDQFFNQLALEEELSKLTQVFTENFMITGEETEDLREVLHRAPDSLIDMIWENIEEVVIQSVERQEKEKVLLSDIPENLETKLIFMDPHKLKLLIRVMNNYPIELMETTIVNEEFIPMGWVFNFLNGNNCTFVVTEQVRQSIMKIEQEDIKAEMEFSFSVRCILNTCLRLYGTFKKELLINLFRNIVLEREDVRILELEANIDIALKTFEEEGFFYRNGNYIVSCELESEEQFQVIIETQKGKSHYIPTDDDFKYYGLGGWIEPTDEYKAVYACLNREIKDSEQAEEMLEEIIKRVVIDNWEIPQIMNQLYDWDVAFDNPQSARRMTKALSEWIYSTKSWDRFGYSPKEGLLPNNQEQYIAYKHMNPVRPVTSDKIYPNEPCPCGSGKKYKKCCGKAI